MKKYIGHLWLSLLVIFLAFSSAMADSPATPWSQVIPSNSGKYVLVWISPKVKEQEEYIFQSREIWRKGAIPAEDVSEAEKALQEEIDKEAAIRKKYSESGLYTAGKSPKLLWKIDFYDLRAWVKVSDNAENIIVVKSAISPIFEEKPSERNPDVREVIKVYPNMEEVILTFYSFGKPLRSYKASELTSIDGGNLQRNTNSAFVWSDEGVLNEKEKTFTLTKTNAERLIFDMSGNLVSGKLSNQQNSASQSEAVNASTQKSESKSFCGAVALLLGFVLLLLFGR